MTLTTRLAAAALIAAVPFLLAAPAARAQSGILNMIPDNVARAAAQNNPLRVRELVSTDRSPNDTSDDGRTALHYAAINGNLQIAAIVLKAGAWLNVKDKQGNAPLHYAAEFDRTEFVELVGDLGATIDIEDKQGATPLMMAAKRGNVAVARVLLKKGANPRKTDFTGHDAVSWASESRKPAVLQLLQQAAAKR